MNVMARFLESEINSQKLYEAIVEYITSVHIRSGEFEGNEYIIKKMDQLNFIIFPEYKYEDGHREIHAAISAYRDNLLQVINNYAKTKGIKITS